jgi:hypothetical protein
VLHDQSAMQSGEADLLIMALLQRFGLGIQQAAEQEEFMYRDIEFHGQLR